MTSVYVISVDATRIVQTPTVPISVPAILVMKFRMITELVLVRNSPTVFVILECFEFFMAAPVSVHGISPVPTIVSILTAAGIMMCCLLCAELIAALLYYRKRKKRKTPTIHPARGNLYGLV